MRPAAVYRMYDAEGDLLYVGCSVQWPTRLEQHIGDKHWFEIVAVVQVEHFDDWGDALSAEATALAEESPRYNVKGVKNLAAARALNEAAWQKARDEAEAERRAKGVYEKWAHCTNCSLNDCIEIPRGTPAEGAECPECGCELRSGNRHSRAAA